MPLGAPLKSQFPVFTRHPKLAYLDTAASSLKPASVIDALADFYRFEYSNIHRGAHFLGDAATERYEASRDRVARFIGASDRREIIFGKNTTEMLNLLAATLPLSNGDTVLLTATEHHANHVPWLLRQQREAACGRQITIDFLEFDPQTKELIVDAAAIAAAAVIAMPHVSNVLGTHNPVAQICEIARKHRTISVVDGAQAIAHTNVDVATLECDFYAFSGHKIYGPSGVGVLCGRLPLLKALPPFLGGGEMISQVERQRFIPAEVPQRFEAGTPPIAEVIALAAALDFVDDRGGSDALGTHEKMLAARAQTGLMAIDGCIIHSHPNAALVTFAIAGVNDFDLGDALSEQQICVRTGLHCAEPLHAALGLRHSVRASFGAYSTTDDVDRLVAAVTKFASAQ